jgi:hypothetical protein
MVDFFKKIMSKNKFEFFSLQNLLNNNSIEQEIPRDIAFAGWNLL